MGLDIRIPIGLMFGVLGVLLTLLRRLQRPRDLRESLGINVNLGWGLVLLVFGVVMLALGRRK